MTEARRGGMGAVVMGGRRRGGNLLMSRAGMNWESSGRSLAGRASESFLDWGTASKAEWRKQRWERVSRTARRQRRPAAVKWRQRRAAFALGWAVSITPV